MNKKIDKPNCYLIKPHVFAFGSERDTLIEILPDISFINQVSAHSAPSSHQPPGHITQILTPHPYQFTLSSNLRYYAYETICEGIILADILTRQKVHIAEPFNASKGEVVLYTKGLLFGKDNNLLLNFFDNRIACIHINTDDKGIITELTTVQPTLHEILRHKLVCNKWPPQQN